MAEWDIFRQVKLIAILLFNDAGHNYPVEIPTFWPSHSLLKFRNVHYTHTSHTILAPLPHSVSASAPGLAAQTKREGTEGRRTPTKRTRRKQLRTSQPAKRPRPSPRESSDPHGHTALHRPTQSKRLRARDNLLRRQRKSEQELGFGKEQGEEGTMEGVPWPNGN